MYKIKLSYTLAPLRIVSAIIISKDITAHADSPDEIVSTHLVFDMFGESPFSDKILFSILSDRFRKLHPLELGTTREKPCACRSGGRIYFRVQAISNFANK